MIAATKLAKNFASSNFSDIPASVSPESVARRFQAIQYRLRKQKPVDDLESWLIRNAVHLS
jgi:hypothetical protein